MSETIVLSVVKNIFEHWGKVGICIKPSLSTNIFSFFFCLNCYYFVYNVFLYNKLSLSLSFYQTKNTNPALAAICYFISWKCYKPDTDSNEVGKKLDFIYQHNGDENSPSPMASPTDDIDDLDIRFNTGDGVNIGGGRGGFSDRGVSTDSPDLTLTTELSASCLSINAGISKSLLDIGDTTTESDALSKQSTNNER